MSRRTIILIIVLTAITAVLLAVALTQKKKAPLPSPQKETMLPYAQTSLEISSNPIPASSASAKSSYSLGVTIDTGGDKVTAVQLELSYDPKAIANVDIKPGSFFVNPAQALKKINSVDGTISYALLINPGESGVSGTGTVAVISYTEIGQTGTYTQINFLPKTLVTAGGTDKSVLKKSIGSLIMIGGNKANALTPTLQPVVSGTAVPQTTNSPSNPFQ